MPQTTNLDKPLAPDPIPASPKTKSDLEWARGNLRVSESSSGIPQVVGFPLSSHVRTHSTAWELRCGWIRRVLKMTLCEFFGSQSKGDVGSGITQGLGSFGSAFLFPLGCFKFTTLLSNHTEPCSEEPWEPSWGSVAVGWLSLRALCHWIAMDTPLLLFLRALGRGGKAG